MHTVRVTEVVDASFLPSEIDVDEYVPLRFRTYEEGDALGGARYIKFGGVDGDIVQLKVPSDSMVLRAFAITMVGDRTEPMRGPSASEPGLPVLELPSDLRFKGPLQQPWVALPSSCKLFLNQNYVEVSLTAHNSFNRIVSHGKVDFLIKASFLVGLRVRELDDAQILHIANRYRKP